MSDVIELSGVCVSIDGARILDRVELVVRAGERVAVCGPNGGGKSTLLDVVVGLRRPDGGRVRVLGRTPPDRGIGFVPQDASASLLPWLSARENVALPLRIAGARARERAASIELARRRVDPASTIDLDVRPNALSGGQRQRVAMMRALVGEPAILVCDEPFSAADAASRESMRVMLRELCEASGRALIIATHDADDVRELATRVVHLAPARRGHGALA
jgi:NitT/TauT family transport system ATP-binding protein